MVLVAYTGEHVIAWQWCDREKHASWSALLQYIPAPTVAIVDGHKGLESALREHWPQTKVQRCLFHIQANIRTHLTMRPNLEAGKELLALAKALTPIQDLDLDQAAVWAGEFASGEARWESFLKTRTYTEKERCRALAHRGEPALVVYASTPASGSWNTGHCFGEWALFIWLTASTNVCKIDRTTSPLEGGINAGLEHLLRDHRGLTDEHPKRAVGWFLYLHSESPKKHINTIEEPIGPAGYDTAFSAEDRNGIQQGWGGRSH